MRKATAFEKSMKGDEESQQLFLRALRNVAEAQEGDSFTVF
jgi:hypothetical protein